MRSSPSKRDWMRAAVMAMANESKMTMVECPTEKKKPTSMGRLPSCINFRVTLSMAEM